MFHIAGDMGLLAYTCSMHATCPLNYFIISIIMLFSKIPLVGLDGNSTNTGW